MRFHTAHYPEATMQCRIRKTLQESMQFIKLSCHILSRSCDIKESIQIRMPAGKLLGLTLHRPSPHRLILLLLSEFLVMHSWGGIPLFLIIDLSRLVFLRLFRFCYFELFVWSFIALIAIYFSLSSSNAANNFLVNCLELFL